MGRVQASSDIVDIKEDKEKFRYIQLCLADLVQQTNGAIQFGSNIRGQFVTAVFTVVDTNTTVTHNLRIIPTGYIVIGLTASLTVYDGTVTSDTTTMTLKASAVGTARLFVF